jgi:glyoxylase-like metal-dependent hydrolase (beta-lactamase superfamily II)
MRNMEKIEIGSFLILKFTFGLLMTNCYLLNSNGEVAVIDASNSNKDENTALYNAIKKNGVLEYIINTHGHFDHIAGNEFLKKEFPNAKLLIHALDRNCLLNPQRNGSVHFSKTIISPDCDSVIDNESTIYVGGAVLKFLHTPGHTKGGIAVIGDGFIFTGDTLFQGTVGITKEYKGAFGEMIDSIKTRILTLPQHYIVLPGHGENSTIEKEANFNVFLQ